MISERIHELCSSTDTVSSLLAKTPTIAPEEAWKQLYGRYPEKESKSTAKAHRDEISSEDLSRATQCGKWGPTQPSELFLRLYHDALCTLDHSVSGCMVSPPLMGSCGTVPLTIISVVPDIMRHMSNLIVRAEKEVILATNYWQNSVASKYITNAMKELSRRAGERGEKIIFKLEYDRGSPKQLLDNHYIVSEKEYLGKAVALPEPHEIPNLDLQVMNFHKPMVGTFHCKYMIVDRKMAVLQSNNIQDNDNMEMLIQLEGPIVDSLYDMALISWSKKLEPPLPSHNSPAALGGLSSFSNTTHNQIFSNEGSIKGHDAVVHPGMMKKQDSFAYEPKDINKSGIVHHARTSNSLVNAAKRDPEDYTGPTITESVVPEEHHHDQTDGIIQGIEQTHMSAKAETPHHLEHGFKSKDLKQGEIVRENARAALVTGDHEHIAHAKEGADVPSQPLKSVRGIVRSPKADTETEAFLSRGSQALPQSAIEHPSPTDDLLPEHTADHPHYDIDIAGEVARVQTAVSPKPGETRVEAVTRHLNHTRNEGFKGNAPECEPHEEMTPYIPHPVHDPFPIAMVCREPFGLPVHTSLYNPQNEVWLSALRNAKKNVFIQSPTLNAEPLVPAIIAACERGIDVHCYICLGYNDTGELLPKQGGTNEMIAHKMYTTLSTAGKEHLHYFFYIGKDQTAPIVAKKKKRDCHVKVMIVDEHMGIQGNGNQDTQSWAHSQEINIMLDSELICRAWIDGLRRNQNTHLYGEVSKEDGVWRDDVGMQSPDTIGVDPGRFSWAKGFMGAIKRVQGTGDF